MSDKCVNDRDSDNLANKKPTIEQRLESWKSACEVYRQPQVVILFLLGFSAGLPFLLVFSTLSAWLTELDVSRTTIGFFSWVGITYSIKVIWAPVVDRIKIPLLDKLLGKRRSWILVAQIGIVLSLVGMGFTQPDGTAWAWFPKDNATGLYQLACLGILVAFSSATQDIAIDAYRIEIVGSSSQGAMSASYIFGYRLALLVAGAGALTLSEYLSWGDTYITMGALMSIGIIAVLIARQPDVEKQSTQGEHAPLVGHTSPGKESTATAQQAPTELTWLKQRDAKWPIWAQNGSEILMLAVASPLIDFFRREGLWAIFLLVLISVYRISDITMGVMANPFYLDMGFSKLEIAGVTKVFGFFMTIFGSFVAGLFVAKFGLLKPLLWGAILVSATNLLFAYMATLPTPSISILTLVISADNFSGGVANVAFIAFLSILTSRDYTATQYALFSSLMTLPGKILGGYSGIIVDGQGYALFFLYAAALGLPAVLLAMVVNKKRLDLKGKTFGHKQTEN